MPLIFDAIKSGDISFCYMLGDEHYSLRSNLGKVIDLSLSPAGQHSEMMQANAMTNVLLGFDEQLHNLYLGL